MTVNELIQALVAQAMEGRGQWTVKWVNLDDGHEYATEDFKLDIIEGKKEIELI